MTKKKLRETRKKKNEQKRLLSGKPNLGYKMHIEEAESFSAAASVRKILLRGSMRYLHLWCADLRAFFR